ncbi:alpha/beta fold hydrolase [Nocardiopsis coralliicola]
MTAAATPFPEPTTVPASGGPLRLYQAGPEGTGPPVLLLHGAMLDTAPLIWHSLFWHLARTRRVLAVDMPRHGGSRPWEGVLDQPAMERMVDDLLKHAGIERVALVGLSMGGGVSVGYALRSPERVAALVALAPGGVESRRALQHTTWRFLQSERHLRRWNRWLFHPAALRWSMRFHLTAGARTPGFERFMELTLQEARRRLDAGERALDDWQIHSYGPRAMALDFGPRLPGLAVPSLWLHGEHDIAVSGAAVRRAAALAPRGRFARIDAAGHLSPLDRPAEVNDLVGGFLDAELGVPGAVPETGA